MRVLLDTNILIHREARTIVRDDIAVGSRGSQILCLAFDLVQIIGNGPGLSKITTGQFIHSLMRLDGAPDLYTEGSDAYNHHDFVTALKDLFAFKILNEKQLQAGTSEEFKNARQGLD
jgi:hypothetical protein